MKTRILGAATLAAVFALGSVALADQTTNPAAPAAQTQPAQVSQYSASTCDPAKDTAIPLAIWTTPQGIFPLAAPPNFGATMRGACTGTQNYAPGSQPFLSTYPYPSSWFVFGPFPSQQYRGT
ncbi:MAG: hypothetical protein JO359_03645 [Candidatus Eremiobacteraeota bacterium]|nr:hypothetical protein [Candidatus Eremiobacteraeota bacterium]